MIKQNKARLELEALESRNLMASSSLSATGLLSILGAAQGDYVVVSNPNPNTVEVFDAYDGSVADFAAAAVKLINFQAGRGDTTVYNNTAVNSVLVAGDGPSTYTLVGGKGQDTLVGGSNPASENYLQATGNGKYFVGIDGDVNIFGAGSDTITVAHAKSVELYDIVGNSYVNVNAQTGYALVNAQSQVTVNPAVQQVTFFQAALTNSKTPVVLQTDAQGRGVLYLTDMTSPNVTYVVNEFGRGPNAQIVVNYQGQLGSGSYVFPRSSVQWVAFFSTTGVSDVEVNSTVNSVLYAKTGSTLIGSLGDVDVLKLHSGSGYVVARGRSNDLFAGPAGPGGSTTLIGGGQNNIFRADVSRISSVLFNVHRRDQVIGVPAYISGDFFANQGQPAVNADFAELVQDLKRPIF
jgi:hypothetical protein